MKTLLEYLKERSEQEVRDITKDGAESYYFVRNIEKYGLSALAELDPLTQYTLISNYVSVFAPKIKP